MPEDVRLDDDLSAMRASALAELTSNILPFWERFGFREDGFLTGKVANDLVVDDAPDRHAVIAARVLWTFSAAAKAGIGDEDRWLAVAAKAREVLTGAFWDVENGGVFWALDCAQQVAADRKQVYAQAFAIYGLAEHADATGDEESLALALGLFDLLETHSRDKELGGYLEAHSREWGELENTALSPKDLSVPKSMNTNLHVLEAYTTLLRVTGDMRVHEALDSLLRSTLTNIVSDDPWPHCTLFFESDWERVGDTISYGHDIEASWLLWDAFEALTEVGPEDDTLGMLTREATLALADAVLMKGVDTDGGVFYEGGPEGVRIAQKHWWPQAEGVVGWLNAFQVAGDPAHRDAALAAWAFTQAHLIDHVNGEWFAELEADGAVRAGVEGDCKVGPWKCPYHNARACLEVVKRVTVEPKG